jgi:hypothetical protein
METTAAIVSRYAARFAQTAPEGHSVFSPLGAWLVYALIADAAEGDVRAGLEEQLGCPADEAARRARVLLDDPHPAVHAAAALWAQQAWLTDRFGTWAGQMAEVVESGGIPDQAVVDAWAARHTNGMIEEFPFDIEPLTAAVLASALACEVTWVEPFDAVGPELLGGLFGDRVDEALQSQPYHRTVILDTSEAGLVGVHAADSVEGVTVVSVIAEADIEAGAVHRAALAAAAYLGGDHTAGTAVDVFDLPLGDGPAWTVTERTIQSSDSPGPLSRSWSVLPAWEAASDFSLEGTPGFTQAALVLEAFLKLEWRPAEVEGRQHAVASYSRTGFKAAAVSAMGMRVGAAWSEPEEALLREVVVKFNHPYAVAAVASPHGVDPDRPWAQTDLEVPEWGQVPVFSAWVAQFRGE